METPLTQTALYQWVLLPLMIFLARVVDVTIDTVRIMLLNKGMKRAAPILGFFQVLIWLIAIQQVFLNLTNVMCYLGFAGGFATGNYVGMIIEERLAIGSQVIRIITGKDATALIQFLKDDGYGVTHVPAKGTAGDVSLIFTIAPRKEIPKVVSLVQRYNPKAFFTVEDVRSVKEGVFPARKPARPSWGRFRR